MNGIIILPLVPLRESDSERSEMISQLLFGEKVQILETRERWLKVCNLSDQYIGWIDRKMLKNLSFEDENQLSKSSVFRIKVALSICKKTTSNETMFLPGGSLLFESKHNEYLMFDDDIKVDESDITINEQSTGENILHIARQYLNAPYLWGGKSILGIDCSGLVQVVFSICGMQMQRDASQQVENGKVIDFISEVQAGDLAFFENEEGKIIHVGILLNSHQIIHASGCVKIDQIDSQGIISSLTGEYTHQLRVIKGILNN